MKFIKKAALAALIIAVPSAQATHIPLGPELLTELLKKFPIITSLGLFAFGTTYAFKNCIKPWQERRAKMAWYKDIVQKRTQK